MGDRMYPRRQTYMHVCMHSSTHSLYSLPQSLIHSLARSLAEPFRLNEMGRPVWEWVEVAKDFEISISLKTTSRSNYFAESLHLISTFVFHVFHPPHYTATPLHSSPLQPLPSYLTRHEPHPTYCMCAASSASTVLRGVGLVCPVP